jgi:hypothetical protein
MVLQGANRVARNIDTRLFALAENDSTLRFWLRTATDMDVAESERQAAIRALQGFLALTPMPSEGWTAEPDDGEPAPVWRRVPPAG